MNRQGKTELIYGDNSEKKIKQHLSQFYTLNKGRKEESRVRTGTMVSIFKKRKNCKSVECAFEIFFFNQELRSR